MSRQKRVVRKKKQLRRVQRFAKQFHSQERVLFFKSLPCEVTKRLSAGVQNAHVKSRGAGGTYKDIVPLSWEVHLDFDGIGEIEFERRYGRSKQSVRDRAPHYQQLWEGYKA
tara:strand:- start:2684 stop:3019 length:336 start_codon:yes stop_codon:yes gene_type:complete